jgi:hypothetical protein
VDNAVAKIKIISWRVLWYTISASLTDTTDELGLG